ncbi:MAG: riboflavin synthase [Ferrimicrobium sp.]
MFSGIVEATVTVASVEADRIRFSLGSWTPDGALGSSIAFDGVCLTTVAKSVDLLEAEVVPETFSRTTIGRWRPGQVVNVEQAMRASDRLDGHIVQGHVDAVATVRRPGADLTIEIPARYTTLVVEKGSIAINGVSLTVVETTGTLVGVALIPETLRRTNLGRLVEDDEVNCEFDIIGKYVARMVSESSQGRSEVSGLSLVRVR